VDGSGLRLLAPGTLEQAAVRRKVKSVLLAVCEMTAIDEGMAGKRCLGQNHIQYLK